METEYLKPFIDGVRELVSTMLQSSCELTAVDGVFCADVSGVVNLRGATQVQVALSFPRDTATRMVAQLLAVEPAEVDDAILGDGVGEMTNIVAGTAKSRISHLRGPIELSIPSVYVSAAHELSLFRADGVVHLRMTTDLGDFSLRVYPNPVP
jgi:chemotaxis protein CheX